MICREIWKNHALVRFSKTTNTTRPSDWCYFEVFEKLTRPYFYQIGLEIMLLPIVIMAQEKLKEKQEILVKHKAIV